MSFNTVDQGFAPGKSGLDRSVDLVIAQARTALNNSYTARATFTTASTNVLTEVWRSDELLPHALWSFAVSIVGANAAKTAYAHYVFAGHAGRAATGAAGILGSVLAVTNIESAAAMGGSVDVDGSCIRVRVNDGAQGTIAWIVNVTMNGVSS